MKSRTQLTPASQALSVGVISMIGGTLSALCERTLC